MPHEILRLEASSNYTKIILTDQQNYISSKVLKSYTPYLESVGFIRLNRTHLVNPEYIRQVHRSGTIQMLYETTIRISKQRKIEVYQNILTAYQRIAGKAMAV